MINAKAKLLLGQFIFPKSELVKRGFIASVNNVGERVFGVYPRWDIPESIQAHNTQKWQLDYFYAIHSHIDLNRVRRLYQII